MTSILNNNIFGEAFTHDNKLCTIVENYNTLRRCDTTILDINYYTNAKCGQKVLFSDKSAYFRSASSDRYNN